jgi:Pectate lyase superfamily protein
MAVFCVRDYGATGNGTTDDTTAVQDTLDAASAAGGGVVYVPEGTYLLTATLTVYSRLSIRGDGDQVSVLRQSGPAATGLRGIDVTFLDVRDLQLRGPGSGSASGPGIFLSRSANPNCEGITMENVFVWQFGDSGVAISLPIASTFTRVIAQQNGAFGISLYGGGTSCALTGCYANGNGQIGYHLGLVYSHLSGCAADSNGIGYYLSPGSRNVAFSACGAEDSIRHDSTYDGTAWKIDGAGDVVLAGCYASATSNVSFRITNSAQSVTLISCTETGPAPGASASFKVDAGCSATIAGWAYATPASLAPGTTTIVNDGHGNVTVPATLRVGGTGMARTTGTLPSALTVSGTAETAVASLTVPAGEAAAGNHYHLSAFGVFTASGSATLTPGLRWGGPGGVSLVSAFTAPTPASGTARPWRMEAWVNFVSASSCYGMLQFHYGTGATSVAIMDIPATTAISGLVTSVAKALALTVKWGAGSPSTLTVQGANIQRWA